MIIGITGGSGCGKTTLLKEIEAAGGLVLDCDAIYHQMLRTDKSLLGAINLRFPGTVRNGVLDRKQLGRIVFQNPPALRDLNAISHGAVRHEVHRRLKNRPEVTAIDAIALFEGDLAYFCNVTVAVTAPLEDRVRRLMARDAIPEDYARSRIAAQHSDDWFQEKCDYVLENDGTLEAFQGKCIAFLRELGIMRT